MRPASTSTVTRNAGDQPQEGMVNAGPPEVDQQFVQRNANAWSICPDRKLEPINTLTAVA